MADFTFYDSLNDFLPDSRKNKPLDYNLKEKASIKDSIEALGIPHPEVNMILVNRSAVNFNYHLQKEDSVEVFPAVSIQSWNENDSLQKPFVLPLKFILDVHLGKLAKYLRLLGFDAMYQNDYSDNEIARLAGNKSRIILTRDIGLLKLKSVEWGYWLRSQALKEQLAEIFTYFQLHNKMAPFTRCLECNGPIQEVEKDKIADQLPPRTKQFYSEFFQCCQCGKVYWKGSHFEHMLQTVSDLIKKQNP